MDVSWYPMQNRFFFAHQKVLKCGFFDGSIKLVKFRWMWIGWMDDMFSIGNRFFSTIDDLRELDLTKMRLISIFQ